MKLNFEAAVGFEPTNKGFADPRLRPLGHAANKQTYKEKSTEVDFRAGDGGRTRDPNLGKVVLYH